MLLSDVVPTPLRAELRDGDSSKLRICGASIRWDAAFLILLSMIPLLVHSTTGMTPGFGTGKTSVTALLLAVNSLLVLQLLRQLTLNGWFAWSLAALFLVHQVPVEGVVSILSSTFLLAGAVCWLKQERTSRDEGWGTVWLLLGLASHAPVVILPPLVLAYDVVIVRRSFVESLFRQLLPIFFCVMLILTMMNAQVTLIDGLRNHNGLCKWRLLALDSNLLCRYAAMLLAPQDLSVLYNPPLIGGFGMILIAIVAWGFLVSWVWRMRRWEPLMTFAGLVWYLLFVPVIELLSFKPIFNRAFVSHAFDSFVKSFVRLASRMRTGCEAMKRMLSDFRVRNIRYSPRDSNADHAPPVILIRGMRIQIP